MGIHPPIESQAHGVQVIELGAVNYFYGGLFMGDSTQLKTLRGEVSDRMEALVARVRAVGVCAEDQHPTAVAIVNAQAQRTLDEVSKALAPLEDLLLVPEE